MDVRGTLSLPSISCPLTPKQLQNNNLNRRQVLAGLSVASLSLLHSGCGMFLYPERRGQPAGRIDWKVVTLDAIGLLLFFVPGLIAFAVDFSTGAIYLPPNHYGQNSPSQPPLKQIEKLKPEELTQKKIEQTLEHHTGKIILLEPGDYQVTRLEQINHFWSAHTNLLKRKTSRMIQAVDFRRS